MMTMTITMMRIIIKMLFLLTLLPGRLFVYVNSQHLGVETISKRLGFNAARSSFNQLK